MQIGWKCEQCTFNNEPSRPGCEMCSADRPASYVVPENCPLSERERLRIEREREVERLSQQVGVSHNNITYMYKPVDSSIYCVLC